MTMRNDAPADSARMFSANKNNCQQCGAWLLAPDWSEYLNEHCVRHIWSCEACGYSFETSVYFTARAEAAEAA